MILRDARLALRALTRARAFSATAVLSLALGIGATTAIFSVVHALLLRPLPYKDADRLVILWNRSPGLAITQDWFSTAQYFDIRHGHSGFDEVAIAIGSNNNLAGDGVEPERVGCIRVSSNLLPMLGADLEVGRLFGPDDDAPGKSGTAILSYGTWTRRYGGDPAVLGRTIRLNDQPFEIIGVLSDRFTLPREVLPTLGVTEDGEILLPLPLTAAARTDRDHEDYNVIGKLKRGVSVAAAQAEMDAITARLRRDFPDVYPPNGGLTFGIVPLLEQVVGDVRRTLWILLGAVGFVLLIACANVANLQLSRALDRQREFAVRTAIGATRGRLVAQLLTESVVLSVIGAAGGVALAAAAVRGTQLLQPGNLPRLHAIAVDATAVAFTVAVALVTGVLFGLAPAAGAGRIDVSGSLKDGGTSTAASGLSARRPTLRSTLVAIELSAAVVLLIGAGLLIRSFVRLQNVEPGFDRRGVLTFELMMAGRQYGNAAAVRSAYRRLWQEIDRLPGVSASGGVTSLPLSGFFAWGPITIEGRMPPAGERFINADQRTVSGRYFEAMRIPLRRGRLFDETDTPDTPRVAIVDERMANEFWPQRDPIGRRIRSGDLAGGPWLTIVGVVGGVKQYALEADSRIALYTPQSQTVGRSLFVVVKSGLDPAALTAAVAQAVHRVDPALPIYRPRTLERVVERSMSQQRFTTWLLTLFAGSALALAVIGVYGMMACLVAQTARDLGIRMALGATPRMIRWWVLRRASGVTAAGIAMGLAGAVVVMRSVRGVMFGIDDLDLALCAAMATILVGAALAASYLPARRATRIDPMASIR
jgi:putative ABC transport system permease protein